MARKILMFYYETCANAIVMMPALLGMNVSGKYIFEMHLLGRDDGAKAFKPYKELAKKETGLDYASPIFVDTASKQLKLISDFETLMGFLEGPEWWKKA